MNCTNCNLRRSAHKARRDNLTLCNPCYEEAMHENDHQDGLHDDDFNLDCPFCQDEADAPDFSMMTATAPHSHAGCYALDMHPKTKAGRAACRAARAKGTTLPIPVTRIQG